jgi:hypothetical protein
MQRFERAKAAIAAMTVEQKVLYATRAADAVFARKPGVMPGHRALWQAFVAAPFGEGTGRAVAVGFPCDPRSDEHMAAQRAGAAALQLERRDVAQAAWLAERSLEHTLAAERGGRLFDVDGLADEVRLAARAQGNAAELEPTGGEGGRSLGRAPAARVTEASGERRGAGRAAT